MILIMAANFKEAARCADNHKVPDHMWRYYSTRERILGFSKPEIWVNESAYLNHNFKALILFAQSRGASFVHMKD